MHFWRILRPVYLSGLQSDLDGHVDTFIKNIGLHDHDLHDRSFVLHDRSFDRMVSMIVVLFVM